MNVDEVNLVVTWSVSGCAVLLVVSLFCTACCLRRGCCGPFSLGTGDIRALKIYSDLYRFNEIEVVDGYFDTEESRIYCWLRRYVRPLNPSLDWASLKIGASKGFLVEVGREMDRRLLTFQHAMWQKWGDNAVCYPVFLVAQEWREWIMDKFQHIEFPDQQHKLMIEQRMAWIRDAREVGRTEIVALRSTMGWDTSDDLSLLQVLRAVGRELRGVHDRWRFYQLQQGFARQAEIIAGFLVQLIRCGVRFLHKLLNQDQLRLNDDVEQIGKDVGYCCCFGLSKYYANALYHQVGTWADDVCLWDPTFPVGYLTRFFSEDKMSEVEANITHLVKKPATSPFAPWNEDFMSLEEKRLADDVLYGLNADTFGLQDPDFRMMIQRSVTLFTEMKCLTECAMVLQTLMTFSGLGGTIFLTNKLGSQHVVEVMEFVSARVKSAENDIIAIGDKAEAGWSYLRRQGVESMWSNSSPVDNARMALRVRSDIHSIVQEVIEAAKGVQVETVTANQLEQNDIEEEISQEVNLYERLWKIIHVRFDKTGTGKSAIQAAVHVHDWSNDQDFLEDDPDLIIDNV